MNKILIASPTAYIKDYCINEWLLNVSHFTYPDFDVFLCDNSPDTTFYNQITDFDFTHKDSTLFVDRVNPFNHSVKSAIAKSHEKCRQFAIKGNYDYLFHLETDLFPRVNIIESLLDAKKKVIGATYFIELGAESKLMVQQIESFGNAHRETYNLDSADLSFVDGRIKQVFSCGLGCVLIHKSVFTNYPFRYEEGAVVHPDSFFYADLNQNQERVFVDTSIHAKHYNQPLLRV